MKIATNKLADLYEFYKKELVGIYDENELYSIFELVCEHYLGYTKGNTKTQFEGNLNQSDVLKIYDTGKALKTGTPIQYILGEAWFYDLKFNVTPATLIPRPETEELVDIIIKDTKAEYLNSKSSYSVLDIGTGSGCIPIAIKHHIRGAKVYGMDVSEDALHVAKQNSVKNNAEVHFIKQDVLTPFNIQNSTFNIIVSNPPYVLKSEAEKMDERVLKHEPHLALFVEDSDPIIFYKRIIDLCHSNLAPNGSLYFELNPLHSMDVKKYANESNLFNFAELIIDMSGKERFLKAQKK